MKLGPRSSLAEVAIAVGDALRRAGISAVLTGGACASVHSHGAHSSLDVDLVLTEACAVADLEHALGGLGFERDRDGYVHARLPFVVEFLRGPLGIGEDFRIRPVWVRRGVARVLSLSATDACRDRLAAFYHWADRQSLKVAVEIALRNRLTYSRVREWSRAEGHLERYEEFLAELGRARRSGRATAAKRPRR